MNIRPFDKARILRMSYANLHKYNNKNAPLQMLETMRGLSGSEITPNIVSWAIKNDVAIDGIYSFKRSMSERRLLRRDCSTKFSEWALNEKIGAYSFISEFGIDTPKVSLSHAPVRKVAAADLVRKVLKPSSGAASKYVYLIYDEDRIFSLMDKKYLAREEMFASLKKAIKVGRLKDSFNLEQLVTEDEAGTPSRDLKFYCFYGKCSLVLEIIRGEKNKYCFHNREGQVVDTGKYIGNTFIGDGVTSNQILMAEKISREIPCPFIRIDFLKSDSNELGMIFGEFTPVPGGYEVFNKETDTMLGKMWSRAQNDLFNDLISGKKFSAFEKVVRK